MTITELTEETVRIACAEMATQLNCLRDEPKTDPAEVVADAAVIEHYITCGYDVAVTCDAKLAFTIRGTNAD